MAYHNIKISLYDESVTSPKHFLPKKEIIKFTQKLQDRSINRQNLSMMNVAVSVYAIRLLLYTGPYVWSARSLGSYQVESEIPLSSEQT